MIASLERPRRSIPRDGLVDLIANPILDGAGVLRAMVLLGTSSATPGAVTATTPTPIGVSVTFTVSRPNLNFLYVVSATANASNQTGKIDVYLDGGANASGWLQWGVGGPTVSSSFQYAQQLQVGSHTIDLRAYSSSGTPAGSIFINGALLQVYQLGS